MMQVIVLLVGLSLLGCSSTEQLRENIEEKPGPVGSVNENGEFDHAAYDQELLAGGRDEVVRLRNLPPDELPKEIRKLVGEMDTNGDGKLDKEELVARLHKVESESYILEADEMFEKEDLDKNGYITFDEYWSTSQKEAPPEAEEEMNDAQIGVKIRFNEADKNRDKKLDREEFGPFLHPYRDSYMTDHLVYDQLHLYDHDEDSRLSLVEFIHAIDVGDEKDDSSEWTIEQTKEFEQKWDKDHDGFLDHDEIKEWLSPSENIYYREEAEHLLSFMDKDRDGYISVEEVEAEFDIFLESPVVDFGHPIHDEF